MHMSPLQHADTHAKMAAPGLQTQQRQRKCNPGQPHCPHSQTSASLSTLQVCFSPKYLIPHTAIMLLCMHSWRCFWHSLTLAADAFQGQLACLYSLTSAFLSTSQVSCSLQVCLLYARCFMRISSPFKLQVCLSPAEAHLLHCCHFSWFLMI